MRALSIVLIAVVIAAILYGAWVLLSPSVPSLSVSQSATEAHPGEFISFEASTSDKNKQVLFKWRQVAGQHLPELEEPHIGNQLRVSLPHFDHDKLENNELKLVVRASFTGETEASEKEVSLRVVCPSWNSDCDEIFDNVEQYALNKEIHSFDIGEFDKDTSKALGIHTYGCLEDAINLPDIGPGYYQLTGDPDDLLYHQDRDDWGTHATLSCIESVGMKATEIGLCGNEQNCIGINDISLRDGGQFGTWKTRRKMREKFHKGHRNGTEIDIRYLVNDLSQSRFSFKSPPESADKDYNFGKSYELIKLFLAECDVARIVVDGDSKIPELPPTELHSKYSPTIPIVSYDTTRKRDHANHIHISLKYNETPGELLCKNGRV